MRKQSAKRDEKTEGRSGEKKRGKRKQSQSAETGRERRKRKRGRNGGGRRSKRKWEQKRKGKTVAEMREPMTGERFDSEAETETGANEKVEVESEICWRKRGRDLDFPLNIGN